MKKYWLGLDIGGTKCAVILAEIRDGICIVDKIRFLTEKGFEKTYEKLCDSIDSILEKNSCAAEQIYAAGISCGGPLDSKTGTVLCPPNLPGWENIPLTRMLTDRYHFPCHLQNDANACALAEWKLGAGRGTHNMIFITMGTGLGAGIIAEGRLLTGCTDMAGEIGHLRLSGDGPVGFGKAGSFEGWCSGGGIARQAQKLTKERIASGNPPAWVREDPDGSNADAALLARYARQGDQDALCFFDGIGKMLGRGLSLLTDAFNPELIVIGSVFARCEDLLRRSMEQEMEKECISYSLSGVKVVPAGTGEAIGDYAAIITAVYGEGMASVLDESFPDENAVYYLDRLMQRYPELAPCREQIENVYEALKSCFLSGHKLLLCGNGGSCADCGHIAGELMKGFLKKRPLNPELAQKISQEAGTLMPDAGQKLQQGLPVIDLTGHAALSTAVQNDLDPLLAPAQQVIAYGRKGDILMGISTSGNARNVALAVSAAKAMGLTTVGLTGRKGGLLREKCDMAVCVPADDPADVQEWHLPVYHALCAMIESCFFRN